MKFLFGLGGAISPVIREFECAPDAEICAGQVVCLNDNNVIDGTLTEKVLGVCVEDHSGKQDILNARSDKNALRVDVTADGVYKVESPVVTSIENGTETTVVVDSAIVTNNSVGAKLVLVEKADMSQNTDEIRTQRTITNVTVSGNKATITVENGGACGVGDKFAVIPAIGTVGVLGEDRESFCDKGTGGIQLKVVGVNTLDNTLEVKIHNKLFD